MDLSAWFEVVGAGDVRVRGTRLNVMTVAQQWRAGRSAEEIADEFPSLSLEAVYASILYYLAARTRMRRCLGRPAVVPGQRIEHGAPDLLVERVFGGREGDVDVLVGAGGGSSRATSPFMRRRMKGRTSRATAWVAGPLRWRSMALPKRSRKPS